MHVSVLGLGRMGHALAVRLLEGGHQVVVWNRSKGKADGLVAAGATEAHTVADAVRAADVVITMLSNDDAIRSTAFGDAGLRVSIGAETVYVDSSTVSPRLSAELAESFPHFVAMPILGNPEAVLSGRAILLAGGDAADVDRISPVLQSLSSTVRRYDQASLAGSAKLTSNLLLLAGVAALAEAFAVGRAGGLSDDALRDLLGESPLVAPSLKNRFEAVLTGTHESWWTTTLGAKDAGLAVDLAATGGVDLPVAVAVRDDYGKAAAAGYAEQDISAIGHLYGLP